MKLIICGDSHIGAVYSLGGPNESGGNTRVDDYEKSLNHIVDYAIANNADAFIQTGDVFDSRTPTPEHLDVFNRAIKKLSNSNIISLIIMGNHDYRRIGTNFTSAINSLSAKEYPNVRILLNPEVISIQKDNEKTNVLLIPFRDRKMYSGKTTKEVCDQFAEHMTSLLENCSNDPTVAIGHNFYFDGSYNHYGGEEIFVYPSTFKKCDFIAMGHYHDFKIISKREPLAIYTGSMEKLNFGDKDNTKYFIEYDTVSKKPKAIKVPSRKLLDLHLDFSKINSDDYMAEIFSELSKIDLSDAIVRLKISINENKRIFIKTNEIEKMLYSNNVFYVSKVILEVIADRIIRDQKILEFKSDFDIFKAFLHSQTELDDCDINDILLEAKQIIG